MTLRNVRNAALVLAIVSCWSDCPHATEDTEHRDHDR